MADSSFFLESGVFYPFDSSSGNIGGGGTLGHLAIWAGSNLLGSAGAPSLALLDTITGLTTETGVLQRTGAGAYSFLGINGSNGLVQLTAASKMPALDGSLLTNLTAGALAGALPALNGSALTSLTAGNLLGALPAISGAALTGVVAASIALTGEVTTSTLVATINKAISPTWTGQHKFGGAFIAQPNYGGSNTGTLLQSVQGTTATPTTNVDASVILQKISNISTNAHNNSAVLISHDMNAAFGSAVGNPTWATGVTIQATDNVGGNPGDNQRFYEALRVQAIIPSGVCGNPAGIITAAIANAGSTYATGLVAIEAQTFNATGVDAVAPASLNPNFIAAAYMASNFAANKSDAAFYTNHFSASPFRTGVYIASSSVDHTAFYNAASLVNGIDLSTGTYSGSQIKGIGFAFDPTGALTVTIPDGAALNARSGASNKFSAFTLGRTTEEMAVAVVGFAGEFLPGTAAGDAAIQSLTGPLWLGTNSSTTAGINFVTHGVLAASIDTSQNFTAVGSVTGTSHKVGSNQVVGARVTGYTAMTGTPDKASAFATSTVTLAQLAGRMMQLQADLTTHGLIGA